MVRVKQYDAYVFNFSSSLFGWYNGYVWASSRTYGMLAAWVLLGRYSAEQYIRVNLGDQLKRLSLEVT